LDDDENEDRVGWMAEIEPGTAFYNLREVACAQMLDFQVCTLLHNRISITQSKV